MKYLLDVSSLVAFGVVEHEFHLRVTKWVRELSARGLPELATCSITELGFIRVIAQTGVYGVSVPEARRLLLKIKAHHAGAFAFLSDSHDVSRLPRWVKGPKQITDGHLVELAKANCAVLATLDHGIPGALLIPG